MFCCPSPALSLDFDDSTASLHIEHSCSCVSISTSKFLGIDYCGVNGDNVQVMDSMLGSVDSSVLERMAKIMSYMRVSAGGKHGKMKKKDKLRMLQVPHCISLRSPFNGPGCEALCFFHADEALV